MALHLDFPRDPHAILAPHLRWYPGEESLRAVSLDHLIPPLVAKVRQGVFMWRESGYAGASDTTRALLNWWFKREHWITDGAGESRQFQYYFGQREAVESAIWLYEIARAHDPLELLRFDSSGLLSSDHFAEDWPRYVLKLATGAGKTKVMSLLIAWSYFHHRYEPESTLANNILLIAPNIIVLDRLRADFDGLQIFYQDPVLPEDGHAGRDWHSDFQMTLHIQDEVHGISDLGNLFLSNIHRIYEPRPSDSDDLLSSLFDLTKPGSSIHSGQLDLGDVVKRVPNLLVLNDEAHHVHDPEMAWSKSIRQLHFALRGKGTQLAAQFDLSATPKHNNGAIFPQVVSDYPLVEAIWQGVVKSPVIPDEASRAKLHEKQSEDYTEIYEDYLNLGVIEWRHASEELRKVNRKAVLFVMTDDTKHCDEVGSFLEATNPDLRGRVLVIHTNSNGDIREAPNKKKDKDELNELREASRNIDSWDSPYHAVVSVMVLREGWDVQNVTTIVGLRAYKAKSNILPEQTLGRGLRRMFRGQPDLQEKVSVIGTDGFMQFVESIKQEGVPLDQVAMGPTTRPKTPLLVEVDHEKDDPETEIELPELTPRVAREYKDLHELDLSQIEHTRHPIRNFTAEEQRQIVFRDIASEEFSHTTAMDSHFTPNITSAIAYFADKIRRDLHLVSGTDILYGHLKRFIRDQLFTETVDLEDMNFLRNLSEPAVTRTLIETVKEGINRLTIKEQGSVEIRHTIKMSRTRPFQANDTTHVLEYPKKSLLTKVIGQSHYELEFAAFLGDSPDVISYIKTNQNTNFKMEYCNHAGTIATYYPDFVVKVSFNEFWVIETKGQEDVDVALKWKRLQQWCDDATNAARPKRYRPLYVKYGVFQAHRPRTFAELVRLCENDRPADSA